MIRCSHLDCGQRDRFVAKVREAMSLAGLNYDNYSGHSFRIGAAMTAAQKGISDPTIKMLGRWKSSTYDKDSRGTTLLGFQPLWCLRTSMNIN